MSKLIIGIIAFSIVAWELFSDNALHFRYYIANVSANPIKTISLTLILGLLILIFFFFFSKWFGNPIESQIKTIEPAMEEFKNHNVKIDSIKRSMTSKYVAIYERLKPINKKLSVEEQILKFMNDARFLYNNYPSAFNAVEGFSRNYDMSKVTQVTALKIEKFKHTFLFVSHNPNEADLKLTYLKYEDLPDNKKLRQILDPVFEDDVLNWLRKEFENRLSKNSENPEKGYQHCSQIMGEWALIGVPDPFNNNNYLSNLLKGVVWLDLAEVK